MFLITFGDVALVDMDANGPNLGVPLLATLGGLVLLRMAMSAWMSLMCCYFAAAVTGTVLRKYLFCQF